ncbi:MAG: winged helix-turn-helix transcriptional regulator [Desulfurococcales archaeon]|nr:winged helix-turn-helix transcriptional regulator [Desulfurococcales archaeon]
MNGSIRVEELFSSRGRVKILKLIIERGEINITQLIKETGLNHKVVSKHLKYLIDAGILEEVRFNRMRIYRPNWINPKVRYLEELLRNL